MTARQSMNDDLLWLARLLAVGVALGVVMALDGCGGGGGPITPTFVPTTAASGGDTTVYLENSAAFESPAANLTPAHLETHVFGDEAFEAAFVTAPALVNPGLGPLFNASSCAGCHLKDGPGRLPDAGQPLVSALIR
ncbi:MAG: di-heme oxidoredictase family protein, partial [bacterium]